MCFYFDYLNAYDALHFTHSGLIMFIEWEDRKYADVIDTLYLPWPQ